MLSLQQKHAHSNGFYKYEWKQALCDKHILSENECPTAAEPANRFWAKSRRLRTPAAPLITYKS